MEEKFDLKKYHLYPKEIVRNAVPADLYSSAIKFDTGALISDTGALVLDSGRKTGRSPKDKRIIERPDSRDHIWWG